LSGRLSFRDFKGNFITLERISDVPYERWIDTRVRTSEFDSIHRRHPRSPPIINPWDDSVYSDLQESNNVARVPEQNYHIRFPVGRNLPDGLTEEDMNHISVWVDNGIRNYVLSYLHHPLEAFFTRYSDGLKLNRKGGPAIIYSGGREEYWIRGEKISKSLIEKLFDETRGLTAIEILTYPNIEDRRKLMECLGDDRLGKKLEDVLEPVNLGYLNGRRYELFKTPDIFGTRRLHYSLYFLKVQDASTTREYYMQVPPSNDALASVAWTFYETKETYNPVVET
jgi:hypothetical protein